MAEPTDQRGHGRVTRKDVARYAGVSTAVVSYALNGGPKGVAEETKARVLEAVRVLGYQPNAAARALSSGSAEMFGLLVPDSRNPFFAELCHTAEAVAEARGKALLIVNAEGGTGEVTRHIESLASRQVDGLLIASYLSPSETVAATSSRIRTVLLNQFSAVEGLPTIGVELEAGARSGVEHLLSHGHTDVGFIGGGHPLDQREAGWREALMAAGLRAGPRLRAGFTAAEGFRAGRELLACEPRPSAVFVSSDVQAVGVLRAVHESGLRAPEDLAVVSFDGTAESEYSWPALTTVRQPLRLMAEDAVNQLLDPTAWSPVFREYPTTLAVRQSCGCPLRVTGGAAG